MENELTEQEEFDPTDYYCEEVPSASINPLFCVKGIDFNRLFRVLHHNDHEDIDDLLATRDKPLVEVPVHHYRLMNSYRNDNDNYTVYQYYNWEDWYDKVVYDDDFPESFSSKLKKVLSVSWKNLQLCRLSKEVWYAKLNEISEREAKRKSEHEPDKEVLDYFKKRKAYYRKRAEVEKHNCHYRSKIYNERA